MNVNFTTQPAEYDPRFAQTSERTSGKVPTDPKRPVQENTQSKGEKLEQLKNVLSDEGITLNFRRDDTTGQLIVEMIDNKTGDAVRQMPSEVSLKLSEAFAKIQGQFIEERA